MTKSSLFVLLTAAAFLQGQTQGQTKQRPLPAGPAKSIVETACTTCHELTLITGGSGHTPADWKLLVERMVAAGADVPKNQVAAVTDYLAKGFPEGNVPKAVIVPGPVKITFKEWTVPTIGSRPHDPLATRDGYLWYTGQYANVLGRVDTKTGEIKEFHPPTKGSGPHGLVEDKDGNVWFTANSKGYIGKLIPRNGEFAEYKIPPDARDPHTPLFDQKGILWFTVQNSQKVGRLDPKTGAIKVVDVPTKPSNPYGMVIDSKGTPYYCAFTAPKIAAIDPNTMAIKEWTLPNPGARPRRIAITSDDVIYYADYDPGVTETSLHCIRAPFDRVPGLRCADFSHAELIPEERVIWNTGAVQNVVGFSVKNVRLAFQSSDCLERVLSRNARHSQALNESGTIETFDIGR